ncbi:MAG: hypothetical protein ACPL7J_04685 [Desulfomonilaceae bacterium]
MDLARAALRIAVFLSLVCMTGMTGAWVDSLAADATRTVKYQGNTGHGRLSSRSEAFVPSLGANLHNRGEDMGASPRLVAATASPEISTKPSRTAAQAEKVWRSQELNMLAIGMSCGDMDGDGQNEIAVIDPHTVSVFRLSSDRLVPLAEYSASPLELKSVDVAVIRKQGPARIYISAQNRGAVSSFVLEYRKGTLVPVIQNIDYFLRVIDYPTHGPILLGQKKGMSRMFEGPVFRMADKGDELVAESRFGIPLKIPIFGFTIGDFTGQRTPLIAVYDRNDHLRIYQPDGKRLYVSKGFFGGSDVLLRWYGPEKQIGGDSRRTESDLEDVYYRPRIRSYDLYGDRVYEILAITHSSKTMRFLSRSKMLEEGQIICLSWNGDALDERWATPKIEGMITDFEINALPGFTGPRLITLERKKTDWLSFLRSKSQVRAYDLKALLREGQENVRKGSSE